MSEEESASPVGERRTARDAARDLARYYDLDVAEESDDLDFYRALASRAGGPVLELGVGSGRIAVPLATEGHVVTGVDRDPQMLERARERWSTFATSAARDAGTLELVEADIVQVRLRGRFRLVLLAFNGLLLLEDAERQDAALRAVARHLRRGGIAAIDIWLPGPDDLVAYDGRLLLEWLREDPETREQVAKLTSATYDSATAVVELRTLFEAAPPGGGPVRRVSRTDRLRLLSADELVRRATDAGLRVEKLAQDYELTPFGPGAERALLVAGLL